MTGTSEQNPRPVWWNKAMRLAVVSLRSKGLAETTANSYAGYLGVPRSSGTSARHGRSRRSFPPFFEWCVAEAINPLANSDANPIQGWLDAMAKAGAGRDVQQRALAAVRGWYKTAGAAGVAVVPPQATPVAATTSDDAPALGLDIVRALRLAAARDQSLFDQRDALILDLLAIAGLRGVELVRLNLDDLVHGDPAGYEIVISESRRVTLPNELGERLSTFIATRREALTDETDQQPLFVGRYGHRLQTPALAAVPHRLCGVLKLNATDPDERAAAEILEPIKTTITPARLRDFAQATARAHGVPSDVVQSWLGVGTENAVSATGPAPSVVVANALLSDNTD